MTDFDKTLHAQLRHLIDDLTVAVDDDGHTRYAPKNTLMFSNFIGALIELMPTLAARAQPAQAVPGLTEQISEGEFAPDAKLMELADKIDHEQNWRHSGIFQRDHLTQEQKDRVLAGVMLRRYADLMAPESWRLFPPKSVVSHSYRAATLEAVIKMAERHGIVGKEGGNG